MSDEKPHELLIIKRVRGHGDGGHGGAWKIAFADFMTAMMALFLVLWLISATNEKTKASLARYFNPVKLVDMTVQKRGLHDPNDRAAEDASSDAPPPSARGSQEKPGSSTAPARQKESQQSKAGKPGQPPNPANYQPQYSEAALFRDPYAVLAEIAASGSAIRASDKAEVDHADTGAATAFQDPFQTAAPMVPQQSASPQGASQPGASLQGASRQGASQQESQASSTGDVGQATAGTAEPQAQPSSAAAATAESKTAIPSKAAMPKQPQVQSTAVPPVEKPANQSAKGTGPVAGETIQPGAKNEAANLAAAKPASPSQESIQATRMQTEIAEALGTTGGKPTIQVKPTRRGVLISLTDGYDYAMFAIGSAEPQPRTVQIMQTIAQILKKEKGEIVISGHTDARQYRSRNYDNWRLSEARAQMALYMLVRGGLDEKRVEKIEGASDHELKDPKHPFAAENRRIDILLRESKS